ncbi:MAG: magnesium transporter [Thermoplasmatota archaeon]
MGATVIRSDASNPASALLKRSVNRLPDRIKPETSLLLQSFWILLVCGLIDLFPGYFLGQYERLLIMVPGLLMILPPTVGLRGNIFGALASRLSSKLHLGTIEPRFRQNKELRVQLMTSAIQLMLLSVAIPAVGLVVGLLFGLEMAGAHELLFISILAGAVSGLLMFGISFGITFLTFRRGWDPDNVSAPIIASTGDILTIPILFFCAWLVIHLPSALVWVLGIGLMLLIISISLAVSMRGALTPKVILRQAFPIALIAVVISTFSGLVLGASFDSLLKGTIFLIMIPAFNGQGGSMGSILGSRVTSAAYLGLHKLTLKPNQLAVSSMISLWLISLVVFSVLGAGGAIIGVMAGMGLPPILQLAMIVIIGSTLITVLTSAAAYYTAYASFKTGLDPDNVVIPMLTAGMDVVGSGSLVIGIALTGMLFVTI